MRQRLWPAFLVAIVCAVTVGLVAQAPSSSSTSQASKQVTFSGCVEKAAAEPGAAPAAGTPSATFMLTNASPAGGSATVGTTGSAKPASKYRLDADEAKISPHVGHKVEVTGTVDEAPTSTSSATSPTGATASASASAGPKIKVDSVKMVAATCQ